MRLETTGPSSSLYATFLCCLKIRTDSYWLIEDFPAAFIAKTYAILLADIFLVSCFPLGGMGIGRA